ncbi:polysaccharide deacetylase family protein [Bacillus kwashiorkori]|uniref:polysaccharide deacetylase family protein n=1 Tax=Bacillus kwashiorkori TaxID=1522318 RepID=UPI0007807ACA|nr:polysaccharide deacetylase family protein [Bacillus kwashiorkori]
MIKGIVFSSILVFFTFPLQANANKEIPILIYHSIQEYKGTGQKELFVTPENFEQQIIYLREHGFTLLTFEQWEKRHNVKKPIFITFDDGYKNNLNVLEIFQKQKTAQFHPTATIFVISDFIGRTNRLSKADLKMLADSGFFSIQSHTATHPNLRETKNLSYELKSSKEKIEKITGKNVIAIAYPYGERDKKVINETKNYYRFGLTTIPKLYSETSIPNELYLLPRVYVKYSTTLEEFAIIVEGKAS